MGTIEGRTYPIVEAEFFRPPYHQDAPGHSLGELDWPEFTGLPQVARDQAALNLVIGQALADFNALYATYQFGQALVACEPDPGTPAGQICRLLQENRACWLKHTRPRFEMTWDEEFRRVVDPATARTTWEMAGFPNAEALPSRISQPKLSLMVLNCLGASVAMTQCVKALFCAETGWNKQTIDDLQRNPNLIRTDRGLSLCNEVFFSQFKTRAGHEVLRRLDRREPLSGTAADEFEAAWRATAGLYDFKPRDGFAMVRSHNATSLLDVLTRYQNAAAFAHTLAEAIGSPMSNRFFLSLGRKGLSVFLLDIGDFFKVGPLSRPGCSFNAARKSRLNVSARSSDSTVEVRAAGDHHSVATTYKHYYNRETLAHKLLPVQTFQKVLQSLLTYEHGVLSAIIDPEQANFLRLIARTSGVASACGLSEDSPGTLALPDISFDPSPSRILELYLTYRAIKEQRNNIAEERWLSQGTLLLGVAGGIIRALHSVGLFPLYLKTARRAIKGLRDGTMVLPPVLEV
ncbi:UNVERIFIED_ORG: hypothetical protein GGE55_001661 [Rhizobium esperanzae]